MSPAGGRPMPAALPRGSRRWRRRLRQPGPPRTAFPAGQAATQAGPDLSEASPGPGGRGGGGPGAALRCGAERSGQRQREAGASSSFSPSSSSSLGAGVGSPAAAGVWCPAVPSPVCDGLAGADQGALPLPGEPGPRGVLGLRRGLVPGAGFRRRLRLLLPQQHRQGEREGGGAGGLRRCPADGDSAEGHRDPQPVGEGMAPGMAGGAGLCGRLVLTSLVRPLEVPPRGPGRPKPRSNPTGARQRSLSARRGCGSRGGRP